jgi:acetyl esterase/lipase
MTFPQQPAPFRWGLASPPAACLAALAAALAGPGSARAAAPPAPPRYRVQAVRNITYYEVRRDPDRYRHRLDVYRPRGKDRCPVLFFLHGGAWVAGSKDDVLGLYGYGTIARRLAERGLVVVLPNYRLSPRVRHPEHVKDVARAFAWACANVRKYGGDPGQLFVGGHSAGGHLAALLATDERYLKQVGRGLKDVRGVIGVSGVYRVEDLELKLSVADPSKSLRFRFHARPFAVAFGGDPKVAREASPLTHVRRGLPPFLILNGGFDYPALRKMGRDFTAALKENGCPVQAKVLPWRTHETLLFDIAHRTADRATTDAIVGFINAHAPAPAARPGR